MRKTFIFDWGGTLYDSSHKALIPRAREVLAFLAERHDLLLVSLVSDGDIPKRRQVFDDCGLHKFFKSVTFVASDKDAAYEAELIKHRLSPTDVVVVDDRAIRGVAWGNRRGATTVWLKRGKWRHELPITPPTHTIRGLGKLIMLFSPKSRA